MKVDYRNITNTASAPNDKCEKALQKSNGPTFMYFKQETAQDPGQKSKSIVGLVKLVMNCMIEF